MSWNNNKPLIISQGVHKFFSGPGYVYKNIKPLINSEIERLNICLDQMEDRNSMMLGSITPSINLESGKKWDRLWGYKPIDTDAFLEEVRNNINYFKAIFYTELYLDEAKELINDEFEYFYGIAEIFGETHLGKLRWRNHISGIFHIGIVKLNTELREWDIETRREVIKHALEEDLVNTQLHLIEANEGIKHHKKRRSSIGYELLEYESYYLESFADLEAYVSKIAPLIKEKRNIKLADPKKNILGENINTSKDTPDLSTIINGTHAIDICNLLKSKYEGIRDVSKVANLYFCLVELGLIDSYADLNIGITETDTARILKKALKSELTANNIRSTLGKKNRDGHDYRRRTSEYIMIKSEIETLLSKYLV